MSSTLKELAIALSKKQEHYVDYLTNESPILDNMRFEASTHGLWNAYEEVSKIDGAGFVDINQPLPEMEVDSSLKKIDLSILGGEIFVPEDKAAVIGVSEYFSKKIPILLKHAGETAEKKIIYDNFIPYAVGNGKAVSAGAADKCYSMVAVRFIPGEVTGLYSAKISTATGFWIQPRLTARSFIKTPTAFWATACALRAISACSWQTRTRCRRLSISRRTRFRPRNRLTICWSTPRRAGFHLYFLPSESALDAQQIQGQRFADDDGRYGRQPQFCGLERHPLHHVVQLQERRRRRG